MKKIIILATDSMAGGITTSIKNCCAVLIQKGHDVTLLNMSADDSGFQDLCEGVRRVSLKGKACYWQLGAKDLKKEKNIIKKIRLVFLALAKKLTIKSGKWYRFIFAKAKIEGAYDAVLAFRQCEPCYYFALNKVDANKKIGYVHGELTYMGDIYSWRKYMLQFDKIAYVSNAVKEQFIATYPELAINACTIYNMFDIEKIKCLASKTCTVKFDSNIKNIVTVARVEKADKQIQWIIEICKKLKSKTDITFHWYVIGDGSDYIEMSNSVKNEKLEGCLTFLGYYENPFPFVKQSDFTVLTSKSEAYGMVTIESLILHKPIVVAEYPAIYEILKNNVTGLIALQNVESITNKVCDLLENRKGILDKLLDNVNKIQIDNEIAYQQLMGEIN